jgi:carbonic anhydrase
MDKIVKGLFEFQDRVFPAHQQEFRRLGIGQNPEALLITCSDSRIDPALLTQTKPGELFICRNAGNIVPGHSDVNGGVTATIEYAVMALKVKDVIVCGHSDCGAMKGVLYPDLLNDMPSVASWLRHADAVRQILKENHPDLSGPELLRAAIEENVVVQLQNLRTHPSIAARLRRGELRLHGWVYEIETGHVTAWDANENKFVPMRDVVAGARAAS